MMDRLEVTEISPDQFPLWDSLVDTSPHGTIFHKSGWLEACARSLGKEVKILGCFTDGGLVGGCSLFFEKSFNFVGSANSTCAVTPYGGLVISPCPSKGVHKQESFFGQIVMAIANSISSRNLYSIIIRNSPEFHDIRPLTAHGWSSSVLNTYYMDNGGNIESQIDSDARYNCRKAERNGITVGLSSDISRFYDMYCETFTRKGLKPQAPKSLISDLSVFLKNKNCGEITVAKTPEGEIAAAEIIIWDTRMAYSWLAASDSRFLDTRATTLLALANLKRMQDRGFRHVNIMMANVPELSQFANHLNPVLIPYFQVQKKNGGNILPLKNLRMFMVLPCIVLLLTLNILETFECMVEIFASIPDFWSSSC